MIKRFLVAFVVILVAPIVGFFLYNAIMHGQDGVITSLNTIVGQLESFLDALKSGPIQLVNVTFWQKGVTALCIAIFLPSRRKSN